MPGEQTKNIVYYKRHPDDESSPFEKWLESTDNNTKGMVRERLKRLKYGLYGDHRNLKGGILEIKFRNGLRIYGAEIGSIVIVILCGGGKKTKREQDKDIAMAKKYLEEFVSRLNN